MKKHYETHVEDTDKLISVAGPILEYKSWYEQYRKLMEEQAQRKYGLYTPTSEGDDDDFPSISGMIARYSASGLTNEQMAENSVWKDLTSNGHDLQMKNFAWKGMSGVGGYGDENYQTFYKFTLDDYVFIASPPGVEHMNFTFRVTGLQPGNKLTLAFFGTTNTVYGTWNKDGIYTVDADIVEAGKPTYFYNGYGATRGEFTIEILPLYPGFILGDGVDDFAVTEKELNFEDTYTVYTAFIPFQNNPTRNMILCGADSKKTFSMQYSSLVYVSFIAGNNYYINADFVNGLNLFACKRNGNNICIKNLLTNKVVTGTCGDWVENAGLYYLWKNATYASFAKAAIAGQTICNGYFSTDEDDEKVLNWYKKQYPWLFPDQAWTVTGKTNEDEDRATIANITGNGNNLVLSNFGFAEGSGYNEEGEYAGYLVTDGVDDRVKDSSFKLNKDWTLVGEWVLLNQKATNAGIVKPFSFVIYNRTTGLSLFINSETSGTTIENVKSIKAICSDGRIYLDDWSEMLINKDQNITSSTSVLSIGFNGTAYTQIAFKNLGIYNDQLLSKDDCIKAYNYLQTLKAK
ncbi:hypothetical protein KNV27_gp062 [uncultured phage cr55_1]|uniref:Uncharacterized protein n=1 Tax=uncultured phage cr55_1 TaxID=2772060 RepID=A0A7M1RUT5_9CAUD|nr:hypothetical protein KNV27_gp062 [uncultured phage cr55_1]QOR58163.1 hypothetical protein [uncultured phage cr55_1]